MGIEGGRRGGHGKGQGAGEAQLLIGDTIALHLVKRKAAKAQNRAAAMKIKVGMGVLCLKESASANKFPTPFQSLQIEKSASKKMKKNRDRKHEGHKVTPSFPDTLNP